jgi:eukaryotic-like serine/threonine-protein kinase
MSSTEIVITVVDPNDGDKRYVFSEPQVCVVGRANDCDIQVPSDDKHLEISRHHCLLLIKPPRLRVRDLGSTNGTFVNGVKIGRRRLSGARRGLLDDTIVQDCTASQLRSGDEVRLAKAALRLNVEIRAAQPHTA